MSPFVQIVASALRKKKLGEDALLTGMAPPTQSTLTPGSKNNPYEPDLSILELNDRPARTKRKKRGLESTLIAGMTEKPKTTSPSLLGSW